MAVRVFKPSGGTQPHHKSSRFMKKEKSCLVWNFPELLHSLRNTYNFSPENYCSIAKDYLELLPNKVCDIFSWYLWWFITCVMCAVYWWPISTSNIWFIFNFRLLSSVISKSVAMGNTAEGTPVMIQSSDKDTMEEMNVGPLPPRPIPQLRYCIFENFQWLMR